MQQTPWETTSLKGEFYFNPINISFQEKELLSKKLFESIRLGKEIDLIENYIKQGADVNYIDDVSKLTPLMMACISGEEDIISLLIDNGADVNKRNYSGSTAIFYCGQRETY